MDSTIIKLEVKDVRYELKFIINVVFRSQIFQVPHLTGE